MNRHLTAYLALGLSGLLVFQLSVPSGHAQVTQSRTLSIVVLEGEGALNNVRQRAARDPVVRIEDEKKRPIAGAAVVFTLPTSGPSGEFANGEKTATVVTDEKGVAAARGLRVNRVAGKLPIHVIASHRGEKSTTVITQFNMEVPGSRSGGSGKLVVILAIIGAAAAGGVVAGTRRSEASSATPPAQPPISVVPGTGAIGPPR